jgi:hypothetical protein
MEKVPHTLVGKVGDYLTSKQAGALNNLFESSHRNRTSLSHLCSLNAFVELGMEHLFKMRDRLEREGWPEVKPLASGDPLILPKIGYGREDLHKQGDKLTEFLDSFGFIVTERYDPLNYIIYTDTFGPDAEGVVKLPPKLCLISYETGPIAFKNLLPAHPNCIVSAVHRFLYEFVPLPGASVCYRVEPGHEKLVQKLGFVGTETRYVSIISDNDAAEFVEGTEVCFSFYDFSRVERIFINGCASLKFYGSLDFVGNTLVMYENHIFSTRLKEFNLENYGGDPEALVFELMQEKELLGESIYWDRINYDVDLINPFPRRVEHKTLEEAQEFLDEMREIVNVRETLKAEFKAQRFSISYGMGRLYERILGVTRVP